MILDLIISNKHIILPTNFSLRLSFKFPLPYLDNIPAASTYWFTIPAVGENNLIFKHANFLNSEDKLKKYDCILVIAGNHIKGKLYLKSAKFREYKCFIVLNDIVEEISDKKIAEIVDDTHFLGDDTDAIIAEAKSLSEQSYPNADYAFPVIFNDLFYSDKNQNYIDYGNRMNQYSWGTSEFVKNYYFGGQVQNVNPLVPMPYLFKVIDEIFKTIRFALAGGVVDDVNFKKMIIFNNVALERSNATNYLHVKHTEELSINDTPDGSHPYNTKLNFTQIVKDDDGTYTESNGFYNSSITGDYRIIFRCDAKAFDYSGQQIGLRVFDGTNFIDVYFQAIGATNDYEYVEGEAIINFTSALALSFYLSVTSAYQNWWAKNIEVEIYPAAEYNIDKFSKQIELKNHVPNLNVSSFLNSLIKKFTWAIFFSFENMQVEIESWANIISNNNYLDLSDYFIKDSENILFENKQFSFKTEWKDDEMLKDNLKSIDSYTNIISGLGPYSNPTSVGQLLYVEFANHYYVSVNDNAGGLEWQFLTDNFQDIIPEGKEVQEIKTVINTVFSRFHTEGQLPEIKQIGTTADTGNNPSGFKLLNYHGLDFIPFASNNKYDRNGNDVGGINLQMQGDDGLYEIHAKDFYDYVSSRDLVEMDFKINAGIFHKIANIFKAGNTIRKVRVGARNYIPETVDITISRNSFDNCKMKLR